MHPVGHLRRYVGIVVVLEAYYHAFREFVILKHRKGTVEMWLIDGARLTDAADYKIERSSAYFAALTGNPRDFLPA
jgi:hypothetical protein